MTDNKPLFSNTHKKTSDEWDFKIPYIGKLNKVLDWLWLKFHRLKFTESNFQVVKQNKDGSYTLKDYALHPPYEK